MIRGLLILLFALVVAFIGIYAYWTAKVSRQKSMDFLTEFRKINDTLRSSDGIIKRGKEKLPNIELTQRVNAIINCIDSMKHELVTLSKQKDKNGGPYSYPEKERVMALKEKLSGLNQYVLAEYLSNKNIEKKDMPDIGDVAAGKSNIPWEVYYFENSSIFGMITELAFIRIQVLKLQYKATH